MGVAGGTGVRTVVTGPVVAFGRHWKRETWVYRLAVPGRSRGRWYVEAELIPADAGPLR